MYRLFTCMILFIAGSCYAQYLEPLVNPEAFKKALQEKSVDIQSVDASFVEYVYSSLLKAPKTSNGKLFFTSNDQLRWEKYQPYSEVTISDGVTIKQQQEGVLVSNEASKRVFKKMESLMKDLLTVSFLESTHFLLTYFENSRSVIIVLKPQRKSLSKRISHIRLLFTKQNLALAELSIYENSLDYIQYAFDQVNYNTELDSELFTDF